MELFIIFIANTNTFSCYKYTDIFHNTQLNNLEKAVNSEVIKTRNGRKKKTGNKTLTIINEGERQKRKTSCMHFIW